MNATYSKDGKPGYVTAAPRTAEKDLRQVAESLDRIARTLADVADATGLDVTDDVDRIRSELSRIADAPTFDEIMQRLDTLRSRIRDAEREKRKREKQMWRLAEAVEGDPFEPFEREAQREAREELPEAEDAVDEARQRVEELREEYRQTRQKVRDYVILETDARALDFSEPDKPEPISRTVGNL